MEIQFHILTNSWPFLVMTAHLLEVQFVAHWRRDCCVKKRTGKRWIKPVVTSTGKIYLLVSTVKFICSRSLEVSPAACFEHVCSKLAPTAMTCWVTPKLVGLGRSRAVRSSAALGDKMPELLENYEKKFTELYKQKLNKGFNPLKPNNNYRGRTAPLTSKRWIL